MKIEKINDKQIKCTLNKSDLLDHKVKISELAFGTDKAKELFRDMMEQASEKFGFNAEDIPLMIEAIPVSADSIVLIITKVENPDDVESKISKITSKLSRKKDASSSNGDEDVFDNIKDLFPVLDEFPEMESIDGPLDEQISLVSVMDSNIDIYDFQTLDQVAKISKILYSLNIKESALYKCADENLYYLVLHYSEENKRCYELIYNSVIEFGHQCSNAPSVEGFLKEQATVLVPKDAIPKFSKVL